MSTQASNHPSPTANHSWTETETDNAALVVEFIHLLMNEHDFDTVRSRFGSGTYTQHNHGIADGLDGVIDTVGDLTKRFPDYSYEIKHVTADGDVVVVHSHATLKASHRGDDRKGFNIIDRWRVADGQLVEHWDAVQPIDLFGRLYTLFTGGRVRNDNGTY
ncbi:MAG: nuclear transport factor 2 family protein [Actinomycetota bacterium]